MESIVATEVFARMRNELIGMGEEEFQKWVDAVSAELNAYNDQECEFDR